MQDMLASWKATWQTLEVSLAKLDAHSSGLMLCGTDGYGFCSAVFLIAMVAGVAELCPPQAALGSGEEPLKPFGERALPGGVGTLPTR